MIYEGDCLEWLKKVPDNSIDLCYIDPPFFTNRNYNEKNKGYSDKWKSIDEFISFFQKRTYLILSKLKSTGSLFVHCDHNASHYIKCSLDRDFIFQSEIFVKSIILNITIKKRFLKNYESIFWFTKTKDYKIIENELYNIVYINKNNYKKIKEYNLNIDEHGIYSDCPYSRHPKSNQKLISRVKEELKSLPDQTKYFHNDNGKIIKSWYFNNKGNIRTRNYIPIINSQIKAIKQTSPFWFNINSNLNSASNERVGYPTQKSINLLEKIIRLVTEPNDTVLDCFCGSGTTAVAAKGLNRKYIIGDINPDAVKIIKKRLNNIQYSLF